MGADGPVEEPGRRTGGAVVEGVVKEQLPSDLYRVTLADQATVLAHVSDRRQNDFLRLLPGERVEIRLSPTDRRRGRILRRVER